MRNNSKIAIYSKMDLHPIIYLKVLKKNTEIKTAWSKAKTGLQR